MKKRKGYKHLLNYCANLIMILFEMMCFTYVWFACYNPLMTNRFGGRGHWGVIGLYVLLAFFFTQSLGGFHIGYLEASDIFSSQALAIIMSAVVASAQHTHPRPVLPVPRNKSPFRGSAHARNHLILFRNQKDHPGAVQ